MNSHNNSTASRFGKPINLQQSPIHHHHYKQTMHPLYRNSRNDSLRQIESKTVNGKRGHKVKVRVNMSNNLIKPDNNDPQPGSLVTYTKIAASPYAPEEEDELYQPMP